MQMVGQVTNSRNELVSIWETSEGFKIWNHEHAVELNCRTIEMAWHKVEENVSEIAE